MDFRWYALTTLVGSLLWCSVLAWLGMTVGRHPELSRVHCTASLRWCWPWRCFAALYYVFVRRAAARR